MYWHQLCILEIGDVHRNWALCEYGAITILYFVIILLLFLQALLNVLRESHRTRMAFRKVGGFVYVMSVLVSMEGCLSDPPKSPWDQGR